MNNGIDRLHIEKLIDYLNDLPQIGQRRYAHDYLLYLQGATQQPTGEQHGLSAGAAKEIRSQFYAILWDKTAALQEVAS